MLPFLKSVVLPTSSANSVQDSGGVLTITGLEPVNKKDIKSINQLLYRAEVDQVVTVSTTAAPVGGTTYWVVVFDPNRDSGAWQESQKKYPYTTSSDLSVEGGSAALQREYINGKLIDKINADSSNHAVAVTLGTGTGFTITDDGGYYPVKSQTMTNILGPNQVYVGGGFPASIATVTTARVYSSGVGSILALMAPVIDNMYGNLISGVLTGPPLTVPASAGAPGLPATAGQNYDAFVIQSLKLSPAHQLSNNQWAYIESTQTAWVDNGTGSSVTNLAGFKAMENLMHIEMAQLFENDYNSTIEFFNKPMAFQGPLGAAPAGTADVLQWTISPYGSLNWTNIGTQTIVAPVLDATGLLIDQDDTAGEGAHYSSNQGAYGKQSFIVGQQEFGVYARVVMGDWTDSHLLVGFRKKAVYTADYNNYTDLGAIGSGAAAGDTITTTGILNNAATVATASAASFADGVSAFLMVKVAIDGTVTAYVNGVSYPIYSAGTTTLKFDAGDEMISFFQHVNIGSGNPAVSIGEFFSVASANLIA